MNKTAKKILIAVLGVLIVGGILLAISGIWKPETPPESKPTTTAPGTTPTGTVAPTTGSVPTTAPVIPTTNPTAPTEPATRPTTQPTVPTTAPTIPTTAPTIPTEPTEPPTVPSIPTEPTTAPTQPTTQPTEPPHVHEYTSEVTKEASCSAEGVKTFTCACGDSYTEKIAKLEHSYTSKVTAPTCTEGGYTTYTCACGDTYTADETAATGHSWGKWTTTQAATEQAPGKEARSCGACDAKEEREIPKLEHKHSYSSKVTKEATCTAEGEKTFSCKCGHSYTEKIAKLKHKYTSEITKPATCAEKGVKTFTCSGCGKSYTEDIAKLDHKYTSEITKPATCGENGIRTYTCSGCGHSYTEEIAKREHYFDRKGAETKPTCTEKGYTTYTCTLCGFVQIGAYTNPAGHKWGAWVTIQEPTENAKGEAKRECSVCHETETWALEFGEHKHSYTATVVPPACRQEGYTLHSCICGDSYMDNIVEGLPHDNMITYFEATCTENGGKRYTCKTCGNIFEKITDWAEGHKFGDWVTTKEPAVGQQGLETRTCSVCGYANSQVIPALDEEWETYMDPQIEVNVGSHGISYDYGDLCVYDARTWGDPPSIRILEDGSFYVVYYKQDGTKVEYTLEPIKDYIHCFNIRDNGTYTVTSIGDLTGEAH